MPVYTIQPMKYNRAKECWERVESDKGACFDVLRDGKPDFVNIKTRAEAEALIKELTA